MSRVSELLAEVRRASERQAPASSFRRRFADANKRSDDELKREIAEEIAFSLGKAGRRLERSLFVLNGLREALVEGQVSEREIPIVRREFEAERRQAESFLFALQIQREALGFRRHDELHRLYPIPQWPLGPERSAGNSSRHPKGLLRRSGDG